MAGKGRGFVVAAGRMELLTELRRTGCRSGGDGLFAEMGRGQAFSFLYSSG